MITNNNNISLPLALFLVEDDYDHVNKENYISATSLIKPIKSIILSSRVKNPSSDVIDFLASRIGTASHARLEKALLNIKKNMYKLGYPQKIIDNVRVNPKKEDIATDTIPIYAEQRTLKEINGFIIGGKFDVVLDETVKDLKTTKVYSWIKGDFKDYILQGSIYRWLNQDLIKKDHMYIDFIFTDWKKFEAEKNTEYPQLPAQSKLLTLLSIEETEAFISNKVNQIDLLKNAPESDIPNCTKKELWQEPTKYAYFKNPKGKRATKVFSNMREANKRFMEDGSVGKIDLRKGKPRRCNYCNAFSVCGQGQGYLTQGLL